MKMGRAPARWSLDRGAALRWGPAVLGALGRADDAQVLADRDIIRAVGEQADERAAGGLLGLVDQLLELALTSRLVFRRGRELLTVVKMVLGGVGEEAEADEADIFVGHNT